MVSDGTVPMNRGNVPLADQPMKISVPSMNSERWKCSAASGTSNPMKLKMTMTGRRPKKGPTPVEGRCDGHEDQRRRKACRWLRWRADSCSLWVKSNSALWRIVAVVSATLSHYRRSAATTTILSLIDNQVPGGHQT